MEEKTNELKKGARFAGVLYLAIIMLTVYGHIYVPSQIFVKGDPIATSNNILAHSFLFRSCIVAGLAESILLLFLGLTLYRLFKQVNYKLASAMVALSLVQLPVAVVIAGFKFSALMILNGQPTGTVSFASSSMQAMSILNMARYAMTMSGIVGAIWLFPFGMLVFRSRFMPRLFGVLLISAGSVYVLEGLISVLSSGYDGEAQILVFIFFLAEVLMMCWLLARGVKDHVSIEVISEKERTTRPEKIKEYFE
ncbi:MAG: DUF4386 domain-containing protein [Flavisolibacter sp.]